MSAAQLSRSNSTRSPAKRGEPIVAAVCAAGQVRADAAAIEVLRRTPETIPGCTLPASFLKHSDEQSICGFVAVVRAIRESGRTLDSFREWGVVAAPRFPGRIIGAGSIAKFFDLGVRGISPQNIPQISLHSLSGVISVGLGLRGPNLGAGGGTKALAEGLTTVFTMLGRGGVPGFWLVVSRWDREPIPQKNGKAIADGSCHAVALALTIEPSSSDRMSLSFQAGHDPSPEAAVEAEPATVMGLAEALAGLDLARAGESLWNFRTNWGAEFALIKQLSS